MSSDTLSSAYPETFIVRKGANGYQVAFMMLLAVVATLLVAGGLFLRPLAAELEETKVYYTSAQLTLGQVVASQIAEGQCVWGSILAFDKAKSHGLDLAGMSATEFTDYQNKHC